jgi:serine/threonine-protein kinase
MIGRTVAHYRILEKIGAGGMGVVYKAEDTKLNRLVALKFLPPELTRDDAAKERFVHEARAASSLEHPNICAIHEIGETAEGQIFICMSYYPGETLKKKIESGPLPVEKAIDIALQIARGLSRAHEAGVVHRDVKLANIMVTDRGEAKILDFGLAKLAGQARLTMSGTTLGTAAYMSPEQARGETVDHRTDIWSLGVVLYEMVCGRVPFVSEYEQATIYLILNNDPPPLADLCPGAPGELEEIIDKCLVKNPDARYQSIDNLIEDLECLVAARPSAVLTKRATTVGRGAAATRVPSIAVLPFRDMSPGRDQEYFCEGIAEELINGLAQIEGLRVAARTSAFQFKDKDVDVRRIGKELGVESVLEGSVRKAGERLRITAQLLNVTDGYHLWSEKYDRDLEDIFAIQDEISLAIVEKLRGKLLKEEKSKLVKRYTDNEEAYSLYLKGRYYWNRRHEGGIQKAIELFQQAVEKDPLYAPGHVGIADCYCSAAHLALMDPRFGYKKAKEAVAKALEIDDNLAEAHASLGWIKTFYDWDWIGAEREFLRAIDLNPKCAVAHYFYGLYLGVVARYDDSVAEASQCQALDPVDLVFNSVRGLALYWDRRYEESIEQLQKTLDMDPSFYLAHLFLGFAFTGKSMWQEAVESFARASALSPGSPLTVGYIGYALGASGRGKDALEQLARLEKMSKEKFVSSFYRALIHLGLGASDQALDCLEKAFVEKESWLPTIATFPLFGDIRSDPRVVALVRKMGLER